MPADSISRMDSSGSTSEGGNTENVYGSSPGASSLRERTDSESSDKTRFVLPSMDGSPPKVLTLDDVANVVKNLQNMTLAHEIALNPDFKLQPYVPPENSLERRIRDIMHKAFWDVLREQLRQTPPSFENAIQLLADIKECFPQILTQNNQSVLDQINEVLDDAVIRQQAENGVLDFKSYANYVIQIMAKSCAPARDEDVRKLTEIVDVVDMFKGILETMALMKLDMANYLLDYARNDIMANSVQYEKEKFKEYLEYYKFGFPATENWLKYCLRRCDDNNKPNTAEKAIWEAYMELTNWDETKAFPEVLSLDKERILRLGKRAKRLCICASLISICLGVPVIAQRPENRTRLSKQIEILVENTDTDEQAQEAVNNVWEQVKKFVNDCLTATDKPIMDESTTETMKTQIMQVANANSPVRMLMWKRLQTYFRFVLHANTNMPPPPPGFIDYHDELKSYSNGLKRVIAYNNSVFKDYFMEILSNAQKQSTDAATAETAQAEETTTLESQQ